MLFESVFLWNLNVDLEISPKLTVISSTTFSGAILKIGRPTEVDRLW